MRRISVQLLVIFFLLTFFPLNPYDTNVQGGPTYITTTSLSSNTIWNISGSPYILKDNLTVPAGLWLRILPGVEVLFNSDMRILVYGSIYAIGNESDPIIFSSNKTDPAPGNWGTIQIEEEANGTASEIRFSRIEYCVTGIQVEGSSPIITDNVIQHILIEGISIEESDAYVANNHILNSSSRGINAEYSNPVIENNTLVNSFYYGMKFYDSYPVLTNNDITGGFTGIELKKSTAKIENNRISRTKYGIELDDSDNSKIIDTVLSNNDYGIYSVDSNGTLVNDTLLSHNNNSFYGLTSTFFLNSSTIEQSQDFDFILKKYSKARLENSFCELSGVQVQEQSEIEVLNYLTVRVENETGIPYNGAKVSIQDNSEPIALFDTGDNGTTNPLLVRDRLILDGGVVVENETFVIVNHSNKYFSDNPRDVAMSISHTEIFSRINMAPELNTTYPDDLQRVNGTVTITGNATDVDGNVTEVVVQFDGGPWHQVTDTDGNWSSWGFEWDTIGFAEGYHSIDLRATDNEGLSSSFDFMLIVDNLPNTAPSVNITSPKSDQIINYTVMISGTAFDEDGAVQIVKVKIDKGPWQDAVRVGYDWSTWGYMWDSTLYSEGTHIIRSRSKDDEGALSSIDTIVVSVKNRENIPPIVNLVSHTDDEEVSGLVTLKGESSDEDGIIDAVEIQIEDGAWQPAINTGITYSTWDFEWDTTLYSNGDRIIRIKAIDDESAISSVLTFNLIVNNGGNMPPAVGITSPIEGQELSGMIVVNGISSDPDGDVKAVQISFDDGVWENTTKMEESWSYWNFSLDTTSYPNGFHTIKARSIDDSEAYSAIFSIALIFYNGGNKPPEVYITSHNNGEQVKGTTSLKGISVDRDGSIGIVEIQIDDGPWFSASQIVTDWSAWEFDWDTLLYSNGIHTINARCTDNTSVYSIIHSIEISVHNGGNIPPSIDITSHSGGEVVSGTVLIKGIAVDLDGVIGRVEINIENGSWQDTEKTVTDWTKWNFELDTTKFPNGEISITVRVTDDETSWAMVTIILEIENEEEIIEPEIKTDSLDLFFLIIIIFLIFITILLLVFLGYTHRRLKNIERKLRKKKKRKIRKVKKKIKKAPTSTETKIIQEEPDSIEEIDELEELLKE